MPGWACACRKCGYHPDRYNRAQDDVAMIYRLSSADCAPAPAPASPADAAQETTSPWLAWLPWR